MEELAIFGGKPVRENKIFYGRQYIDQADVDAVAAVMTSDYITCGPKVKELEEHLCELTHAKYAVVVCNGTAALHLAALAAGFGEGDEVIVSSITFLPTVYYMPVQSRSLRILTRRLIILIRHPFGS